MAEGLTDQDLANLEMQTSMAGIKRTSEAAGIDLTTAKPINETDLEKDKNKVKKWLAFFWLALLTLKGQCPRSTLDFLTPIAPLSRDSTNTCSAKVPNDNRVTRWHHQHVKAFHTFGCKDAAAAAALPLWSLTHHSRPPRRPVQRPPATGNFNFVSQVPLGHRTSERSPALFRTTSKTPLNLTHTATLLRMAYLASPSTPAATPCALRVMMDVFDIPQYLHYLDRNCSACTAILAYHHLSYLIPLYRLTDPAADDTTRCATHPTTNCVACTSLSRPLIFYEQCYYHFEIHCAHAALQLTRTYTYHRHYFDNSFYTHSLYRTVSFTSRSRTTHTRTLSWLSSRRKTTTGTSSQLSAYSLPLLRLLRTLTALMSSLIPALSRMEKSVLLMCTLTFEVLCKFGRTIKAYLNC